MPWMSCPVSARSDKGRSDSEYFTSAAFRDEVIEELMKVGASHEQTVNRTRDQMRLFNEARQLGLM
jgi:hypothetical protein